MLSVEDELRRLTAWNRSCSVVWPFGGRRFCVFFQLFQGVWRLSGGVCGILCGTAASEHALVKYVLMMSNGDMRSFAPVPLRGEKTAGVKQHMQCRDWKNSLSPMQPIEKLQTSEV